ncbi:Two-component response regulator ARR9 [Platanthera zijinensis]|uniref:Two-component response regulator ARR9 n=1 Tax=Platanthera zijinensis TaxID=2320716 RepID=A0AAP0BKF4_9ASPA
MNNCPKLEDSLYCKGAGGLLKIELKAAALFSSSISVMIRSSKSGIKVLSMTKVGPGGLDLYVSSGTPPPMGCLCDAILVPRGFGGSSFVTTYDLRQSGAEATPQNFQLYRCLEEGADEFFLKPVQLSDMQKLRPHILKGKFHESSSSSSKSRSVIHTTQVPPPLQDSSTDLSNDPVAMSGVEIIILDWRYLYFGAIIYVALMFRLLLKFLNNSSLVLSSPSSPEISQDSSSSYISCDNLDDVRLTEALSRMIQDGTHDLSLKVNLDVKLHSRSYKSCAGELRTPTLVKPLQINKVHNYGKIRKATHAVCRDHLLPIISFPFLFGGVFAVNKGGVVVFTVSPLESAHDLSRWSLTSVTPASSSSYVTSSPLFPKAISFVRYSTGRTRPGSRNSPLSLGEHEPGSCDSPAPRAEDEVVGVSRKSDRILALKLVIGKETINYLDFDAIVGGRSILPGGSDQNDQVDVVDAVDFMLLAITRCAGSTRHSNSLRRPIASRAPCYARHAGVDDRLQGDDRKRLGVSAIPPAFPTSEKEHSFSSLFKDVLGFENDHSGGEGDS